MPVDPHNCDHDFALIELTAVGAVWYCLMECGECHLMIHGDLVRRAKKPAKQRGRLLEKGNGK